MKGYYFTFGCGIDNLHRNCYHVIEVETQEAARKIMFDRFGAKWAFQLEVILVRECNKQLKRLPVSDAIDAERIDENESKS